MRAQLLVWPRARSTTSSSAFPIVAARSCGVSMWNSMRAELCHGREAEKRRRCAPSMPPSSRLTKTTVSRICRELRDRYTAFCNKSLADVSVMALFMDATYLPTRPSGQKEGVLVVWGIRLPANACCWRCVSASASRTKTGWISAAISHAADCERPGWWSATGHLV